MRKIPTPPLTPCSPQQTERGKVAGKTRRSFAVMDPEEQRAIARRGGQAAHDSGKAHEFTSEEARRAGAKGGISLSQDRKHMSRLGRIGGFATARKRKA